MRKSSTTLAIKDIIPSHFPIIAFREGVTCIPQIRIKGKIEKTRDNNRKTLRAQSIMKRSPILLMGGDNIASTHTSMFRIWKIIATIPYVRIRLFLSINFTLLTSLYIHYGNNAH